jgi:hypothetical protein
MKQFKKFKKHRWFIWTIVISVVSLVGLATYIYSVSSRDQSEVPVIFNKPKNIVTSKVSVKLPVTQANSTYLVKNIQLVQDYLRAHSKARVTPDAQINTEIPQNPYWPVHVYQDLKDHTETFGWYDVYVKSGVIIKQ